MKLRTGLCAALLTVLATGGFAAERVWQTGTWTEINTRRPRFVFGLNPSPNGPGPHTPTTTLVRTYTIETDTQRFELRDVTPVSRRTVDAIVGEAVTFAVEKKTLYVRGPDGFEHRLRIIRTLAQKRDK
jgi:hypothetical protein